MKIPIVRQHDEKDCGAACLSMIAEYYGRKLSLVNCRQLIHTDQNGANIYAITCGAKQIGLDAEAKKGSPDELKRELMDSKISIPFIAHIIAHGIITVPDPSIGRASTNPMNNAINKGYCTLNPANCKI